MVARASTLTPLHLPPTHLSQFTKHASISLTLLPSPPNLVPYSPLSNHPHINPTVLSTQYPSFLLVNDALDIHHPRYPTRTTTYQQGSMPYTSGQVSHLRPGGTIRSHRKPGTCPRADVTTNSHNPVFVVQSGVRHCRTSAVVQFTCACRRITPHSLTYSRIRTNNLRTDESVATDLYS